MAQLYSKNCLTIGLKIMYFHGIRFCLTSMVRQDLMFNIHMLEHLAS